MSHIPGRAVAALFALTECQAADEARICITFDGTGNPVPIKNEDGTPLQLGQLRELAAAFGAWL